MAWVKVDDQFFFKPRARQAGKDGRALFWAGLCFCAANRTDGVIVNDALPLVAAMAEVEQTVAHLLVDVGLWTHDDERFHVVDFLKFNPSREQLEAEAAAAAERQSRARSRRESQRDAERSDDVSPPAPSPSPVPDVPSPLPSSSDLNRLPADLWTTIADKKQAKAKDIGNLARWRKKVIENDRADVELVARAVEILNEFEVSTSYLADCLIGGTNPKPEYRRRAA